MSLEIGMSVLGLTISVLSFLTSYTKASKAEVKEQENRFTKLEGTTFTKEDRDRMTRIEDAIKDLKEHQVTPEEKKCYQEDSIKVKLLWTLVETEIPKMLRHTHTPRFDYLLELASKVGIKSLSKEDARELIQGLETDLAESKKKEDTGRAVIAAFYLTVVNYELGVIHIDGCQ